MTLQALLSNPAFMAGLGLLSGNTPSPQPVNPLSGMMSGLVAGGNFQNQIQDNETRRMLMALQMARLGAAQQQRPISLKPGDTLLDPTTYKPIANIPNAPGKPVTRERQEGTTVVQEEWDVKEMKWKEVGRGPKWQPESTRSDVPYYNYQSTPQGIVKLDMRGREEPQYITDASGKPIVKDTASPGLRSELAKAESFGTEMGAAQANLASREAALPKLMTVVNQLGELGKKATYTAVGQAMGATKRQLGMPVGEGMEARAAYIAKIDNEVLPLLRETFGAQFTQKEGESLKITLGDPDKSPAEKDAVLRAFIQSKVLEIEKLRRQVGAMPQDSMTPTADQGGWGIRKK